MYSFGAVTTFLQPSTTTTLVNPLGVAAAKGSVAEAWASSLAASFQVRMQKAGNDIWSPLAIQFDYCSKNPGASSSDPNVLFDVACDAPEPLGQYVGTAAMAEITNGNSQLHKDMRSYLSSVASQYGAGATQGMIGTFATLVAPLVAPLGKTKSDVVSGDAATAWNNDLKSISGASRAPAPTMLAQKTLTFAPQTVTTSSTSSTTPAQVTPQQVAPGCPAGTQLTNGVCMPIPIGPPIVTVEATPPSATPTTFQKALPWIAGAAVLGGVLWYAGRR